MVLKCMRQHRTTAWHPCAGSTCAMRKFGADKCWVMIQTTDITIHVFTISTERKTNLLYFFIGWCFGTTIIKRMVKSVFRFLLIKYLASLLSKLHTTAINKIFISYHYPCSAIWHAWNKGFPKPFLWRKRALIDQCLIASIKQLVVDHGPVVASGERRGGLREGWSVLTV